MSTSIKWGIIGGIGWTASLSTMLATSQNANPKMQLVYLLVGVLISAFTIFIGLRAYKTEVGELNIEKGIREGLKMVIVASLLMTILLLIYLEFINPSVIENYRQLLIKGVEVSNDDPDLKRKSLEGIQGVTSSFQIVVRTFLPRVVLSGGTFVIVSTFLLRKLNF